MTNEEAPQPVNPGVQAEAPAPQTEQNGESKPEEAKPAETTLPQAPVILNEPVERVEEVQITKQSKRLAVSL